MKWLTGTMMTDMGTLVVHDVDTTSLIERARKRLKDDGATLDFEEDWLNITSTDEIETSEQLVEWLNDHFKTRND